MSRIHASADTTLTPQSVTFPEPVFHPSVFGAHQLPAGDAFHPVARPAPPDWIPGVLLLCFLLLAWVQVYFHKRARQVFQAPFSQRFVNQLMRDGNLFQERIAPALATVYLLTSSLFLYELNERVLHLTFPGLSGLSLYGLLLLAGIALPALKTGVIHLLGVIFRTRETTAAYLLNLLLIALITGPVLLAGLVFIIYLPSDFLVYVLLGILAILFLFRFVRGLMTGLTLTKFSYLLLFVYLCTLEILPLLLLVKILLNRA